MLGDLRKRHQDWAQRRANVAWLEPDELAQRMGDGRYLGVWIDKRGGGVQPLSYARGLARAAMGLGARVHGSTLVRSLNQTANGWRLETANGALTAGKVILATNGYTDGL